MTASEYLSEAAQAAADTARHVAARDRHTHTGATFDFAQPLPPLRKHRTRQEWETQEPTNETP